MQKPTVADLGERALVERIRARLAMPSWVVVGPGDDGAVVAPVRGLLEVFTTDAMVEGIHFDRRFVPSDAIGHRALAVNLSDLAAMGAEPRAALLSLVLPDVFAIDELDALLDGLLRLAAAQRVTLIGGNITRSPGPLIVDVTAIGSVHRRRVLKREGARPGDGVYVTGWLGNGVIGLRRLQQRGGFATPDPAEAHYLRPQPRVRAGVMLGRNRVASSCMDLSDGLADGVRQIAACSGVGMLLDSSSLPIGADVSSWHEQNGGSPLETALSGGDDYELLFTVRAAHLGRLRGVRQHIGDLPITRIGVVTRDPQLLVTAQGGTRVLPDGFEHFR
ncbi:MAG TPA: thiamine-phosphate kinase [Vicinamibacterales bacterium]|nr:thiamine-phosphate kinase [Vicinamibacterales bacterium]